MKCIVQGLLVNYEQIGKGSDVVMLHGWGDSLEGMRPLAQMLASSYRITILDLPGFGKTQNPGSAWGLTDYAIFVEDIINKLSLKPKILIGHSNGGAIAVRAVSRGLSVDKLVLLASSGIRGEANTRNKFLRYMSKIGKIIIRILPLATRNSIRRRVYNAIGSDFLVKEDLQETFKKIVADDVRNDAQKILIPTLLVYGDNDTATPPQYAHILHKYIPESELVFIANADHWIITKNTNDVLKHIREFIK